MLYVDNVSIIIVTYMQQKNLYQEFLYVFLNLGGNQRDTGPHSSPVFF